MGSAGVPAGWAGRRPGALCRSGYNLARSAPRIIIAPGAADAIQRLDARTRSEVRDHIELHLRYEPTKLSKSRIKRLRGMQQPQYRLRVGEIRVFYDVDHEHAEVHVLAVVSKAEASQWLDIEGTPE